MLCSDMFSVSSFTCGSHFFFQVISLRDSLIIRSSAKKHIVTVKGIPACIIEYKKREDDKKLLERHASPKQTCLKKDLIA